MIPLNLVVGVAVIILNSLVGHFYRKGKRSTAALLYIYLTGWDVTMGVTAVLHAIYMIITVTTDMEAAEETMKVLISGVYVVTNVAVRSSVFANTVLSVVRTINISQPFYRVRRRTLHIVYWTCFVFLIAISAVDTWLILSSSKGQRLRRPLKQIINLMFLNPAMGSTIIDVLTPPPSIVRNSCLVNVFFHLATLINFVCLAVHANILVRRSRELMVSDTPSSWAVKNIFAKRWNKKAIDKNKMDCQAEEPPIFQNEAIANPAALDNGSDTVGKAITVRSCDENSMKNSEKQDASVLPSVRPEKGSSKAPQRASTERKSGTRTIVTVMQLSAVFCLCNTAYTVFVIWLVDTTKKRGRDARQANADPMIVMTDRLLFYLTSTFVPFLNSLINPLILICRSSNLNQFVKSASHRLYQSQSQTVRNSSQVSNT